MEIRNQKIPKLAFILPGHINKVITRLATLELNPINTAACYLINPTYELTFTGISNSPVEHFLTDNMTADCGVSCFYFMKKSNLTIYLRNVGTSIICTS